MNKKEFSAMDSLKFGWETFLKRPSFLVVVMAVVGIAIMILNALSRGSGLLSFLVAIIGLFVGMGLINFALKAQKDVKSVEFADLWYPQKFWYYLGAVILVAIAVVVGFILIIIPGIIAISMFAFVKYIVIDKDMGPIEALKESMRITEGHRLEVLLLIVMSIVINIIGLLPLMLGLLVTVPVTILAYANAYRTLEGLAKKEQKTEAAA